MKTKEEIEILRADAFAGDAVAQNNLGCAYSSGDGVAKNLKEAFMWFERSAKQGNKYAQYNIGRYYEYGWGTIKNIQSALEWYKLSAEQGYGQAANKLGEIYEKGYKHSLVESVSNRDLSETVAANPEEAFYWYKRGQNSDDSAKLNLARCYELGIGTPKSLFMACKLYSDCKDEKAKQKLNTIRQTYNPILDTKLQNVELLGKNPYRMLGVWSNSSGREIRANLSKIEAMSRVGKTTSFESDHIIPCDIADFISDYTNRIKYLEDRLRVSPTYSKTPIEDNIKRCNETLKEWKDVEQQIPSWNIYPNRTAESIANTKAKLASEKERIKYALFWFCNNTPDDEKALKLLSEHKWYEAQKIWFNRINFSACINNAVMQWSVGNNFDAIISILKLIHKESFRNEFISVISNESIELSEDELSQMFWDTLYEFPETELSKYDILRYGCGKASLNEKIVTEKDIEYNLNKGFNILKSPLDELLRNASNLDENDFEKGRSTYYEIIKEAPNILLRIKRIVGEDYYRYKLLCNEIAEKLLEFAIHYNNDKTDDWSAPQTAFYIATSAMNIAIDENLRERCERNVEIFKRNKQILSTNKSLEAIDTIFKEVDEKSVTLSQAEKLQTDVAMFLECIKTENGKGSDLYKNVSDNAINAILNVIIAICNRDKDATTAISASGLLKKLKSMDMSSETRSRLERNSSIISNNMVAAMRRGNLGDLGGSGKTYSKEENKSRRIHKTFATVCSIVAFALMWYYMSWNNNLQYFMDTMPLWGYICIIIMVFIALFPIIMWGLEFQKDPHNTRFYWLDNSVESLYNLSNDIMRAGVQGRKTYSWPFAIPFQLLGIAIWILSFPIKGMAKLAAMIK